MQLQGNEFAGLARFTMSKYRLKHWMNLRSNSMQEPEQLLKLFLVVQNSSNVEGGEEPPELHGAPQGEVAGECLRGGWAPLLHRAGTAHLTP